jgi:hypothetical protein
MPFTIMPASLGCAVNSGNALVEMGHTKKQVLRSPNQFTWSEHAHSCFLFESNAVLVSTYRSERK